MRARHLIVQQHFGRGGARATVGARHHQGIGARRAHRRVLVGAAEVARTGPAEAAVARALQRHAGRGAGDRATGGLGTGLIGVPDDDRFSRSHAGQRTILRLDAGAGDRQHIAARGGNEGVLIGAGEPVGAGPGEAHVGGEAGSLELDGRLQAADLPSNGAGTGGGAIDGHVGVHRGHTAIGPGDGQRVGAGHVHHRGGIGAGEPTGTAPSQGAAATALQLSGQDVAVDGAALRRSLGSGVVRDDLSRGGARAAVGARHHQGVGARRAHCRVLVGAAEIARTGPAEAAGARALQRHARGGAGDRATGRLRTGRRGVHRHIDLVGAGAARLGIGDGEHIGAGDVDGRGGGTCARYDARAGPGEVQPARHTAAAQLHRGTRGARDLRIIAREGRGRHGAGDVHRQGDGALVEVGDGHGVGTGRDVGEVRSHRARAPHIAIARGSAGAAGRCATRARVAGIQGGVDGGGERGGLTHREVGAGAASVGIGHRHADRSGAQARGGCARLAVAPGEREGRLSIGGGRDAAVTAAVAGGIAHRSARGHDAHFHHLIGRPGEDAGIAADDASDVGVRRDGTDQGTRKVLPGGARDVRPGEAVGTDLPLIGGGAAERRIGGGDVVAHDGGQHIARFGAGDVAGRAARTDGHTLVSDAVAQQVRRVRPHHEPRLIPGGGAHLGGVERALGEGDGIAAGGDDGVDAAVAELDAALADRIVIVRGAAVVGAEEQRAQVVLQLGEGLVVASLVGGLERHVRGRARREVGAVRVAEHIDIVVLVHVQAHHVHLVAAASEVGGPDEGLVDAHAAHVEVVAAVVRAVEHAGAADVGGGQSTGDATEVQLRPRRVELHAQHGGSGAGGGTEVAAPGDPAR